MLEVGKIYQSRDPDNGAREVIAVRDGKVWAVRKGGNAATAYCYCAETGKSLDFGPSYDLIPRPRVVVSHAVVKAAQSGGTLRDSVEAAIEAWRLEGCPTE